jgi:hypothetical protein
MKYEKCTEFDALATNELHELTVGAAEGVPPPLNDD